MTRPLFKNFGEHAEQAVSVTKALGEVFEQGNPGQDGTFVEATVGTTGTRVEHDLGREPTGWLVIDRTDNEPVYRTAWDSTSITLEAANATTIRLWIF